MKIIALLVVLVLFSGIQVPTGVYDSRVESLPDVNSFVPESENFIHIGGGFFAHFNNLKGSMKYPGRESNGSVQFSLDSLEWISRYVYRPGGVLTIRRSSGESLVFTMERLDYVRHPEDGRALYRLTARNDGATATLVTETPGFTGSGAPKLEGSLVVRTRDRICKIPVTRILITGRSENDAERHLNHVVGAVSDFSQTRNRYDSSQELSGTTSL